MTRHTTIAALSVLLLSFAGASHADPQDPPCIPSTPSAYRNATGGVYIASTVDGTTVTTNETAITPELQALARTLLHDPKLIFEYVRDRIDYIPTTGIHVGAHGCYMAGRGNDWDQSALLIALLRTSGYVSRFGYGHAYYFESDLTDWLCVPEAAVDEILRTAGGYAGDDPNYPGEIFVNRVWAEVELNEQWYRLDPAVRDNRSDSIDFPTAMNHSASSLRTTALQGATIGTGSVDDLNRNGIRAALQTYVTNLLGYTEAYYPHAGVDEIFDLRRVSPVAVTNLPTQIPRITWIGREEYYDHIAPTNCLTFRVQHPNGIDHTFKGYEIADASLSLRHNESQYPQLWMDNTLIASGASAAATGTWYDISMGTHVPVDKYWGGELGTRYDSTGTSRTTAGGLYSIVHYFNNIGPRSLQSTAERVAAATALGSTEEQLAVLDQMRVSYSYQSGRNANIAIAPWGVEQLILHNRGVIGVDETGMCVRMGGGRRTARVHSGDEELRYDAFRSLSLMGSALEHGVLEQYQDEPSVSTIALLDLNISNDDTTFFATTSTWSTVKSQIQSSYSSSRLTKIENDIQGTNAAYVLPASDSLNVNDWTGIGYMRLSYPNHMMSMYISGGDHGGAGTTDSELDGEAAATVSTPGQGYVSAIPDTTGADPVSLTSGAFLLDSTDLALGSGSAPRGLALSRHYRSSGNLSDGPLGRGWRHSYQGTARETTRPGIGWGERTPADVSAQIVQHTVLADIMSGERDATDWAMAAVVTKWAMDQLTQNCVTIELGNQTFDFTRQPDGSYTPPPGVTSQLIKTNGLYRLQERFGKEFRFNADNNLASIVDADGNTMTLAYNTATNLQTVTDAYDRSLTFSYSSGRVSQVSDGTGRSISYGYTSSNLTSVTDADSHTWTYGYDSDNRIETTADPLSQTTVSNIYNALGHVVTQYNGAAEQWTFYCGDYRGAEVDPLGGETAHWFDRDGRNLGTQDALSNRTYKVYDGQGHLVTNIDANGNSTLLRYDANHNLTTRTDALGNEWSYQYDGEHHLIGESDPLGNTVRYEYDSEHHLTSVSNALGETTTTYTTDGLPYVVTDANGNQATYTYDSYSNPERIARTAGGTMTNTWNARGELVVGRDALGNETSYTYNNRGLVTSVTDEDGNEVSYVYSDAALKTHVTDQRDNTTTYTYTPTYEISTIAYPDRGSVSNTYDAANRLVAITDGEDNTTTISRDDAGRRTAVTDALTHTVSYALDANGNRVAVTNARSHVVYSAFDALNRVTNTWDEVGSQTRRSISTFDSAGRLTSVTDPASQTSSYAHDALGRVTMVTRPDQATENNGFDAVGNRLSYTNAKGVAVVRTTYDGMSRPLTQTNALNDGKSWTYDATGNQLTRTDGNGDTTDYTFDELNRVESVEYPDSSAVNFTYDEAGNLSSALNSDATVGFGYDEMNRVSVATQSVLSVSSVVGYSYDKNGNRTGLALPGSESVTYTYDDANRLNGLSSTLFGSSFTFTYSDANELTGITYPNGVTATYTRDDGGRVTGITYADGGTTHASRTYTYNALDQITKRNITTGYEVTPPDTHQHMRHNMADQLTHVSRMDNYESPEKWRDVSSKFDDNGATTNITVGYDGMTQPGSFGWDYEGRLTSYSGEHQTNLWYTVPPIPASLGFKYDALGGRVTRSGVTGGEKIHVLDHAAQLKNVLVQRSSNGTIERYYIYAPGFGLVAHIEADGTECYYHGDHLGSTILLTDGNGDVTDQFDYTPYGELLGRTGATDTPYTFVGRHGVYWEGAALYHMKARYYRADLARFISVDPLGIAGGVNLYAYANGDPMRFLDALGLCSQSPWYGNVASDLAELGGEIRDYATGGDYQALGFLAPLAVVPAAASGITYVGGTVVNQVRNAATAIATAGSTVAGAVNAGINRLTSWQPASSTIDQVILHYPNAAPVRHSVGDMIYQATPAVEFASGFFTTGLPQTSPEAAGVLADYAIGVITDE